MVDLNINTHALGNSFTHINAFYDLYVNGAKTVSPSQMIAPHQVHSMLK